ncbi:MAG: diguanylate cyclase [Comamonas sp.]
MSATREPTRERHSWWLLALVWLLLGVVLAADVWQTHRDLQVRERERLSHQASTLADNLVPQLDAANHAMQSLLSELPRLQGEADGPAQLTVRLKAYSDAMTAVQYMSLLDARGTIVASSEPSLLGVKPGDRSYFKTAEQASPSDTLVVSPPFRCALDGWVMVLARKVVASDGRFVGVLAAALDARYFRTLLQSLRYAPDVFISVSHGEGLRFLAVGHPGAREGVSLDYPGNPWLAHRQSGASVSLLTGSMRPSDASIQLVALRTVQPAELHMDQPLIVAVGRDVPAIFAMWRTHLWRAVLGWLLVGAAAAAALAWQQRKSRQLQRRQEALETREEEDQARWDAVLSAAELGLWDHDVASGVTTHSPGWYAMLGHTQESFTRVHRSWRELVHPDDRQMLSQQWQPFVEGRATQFECVLRLCAADGAWKWFLCRGRAIAHDANGRPTRVLGTFLDMSERHQHDEMLQHLIENVPGMLYQYQIDPDGHSHFPYTSPRVTEVYGFSSEELRRDAAPVFQRIRTSDLRRGLDDIRASARDLTEWTAEYRFQIPGRGERWLSGHARPQRLASGATLWYGYINDVTEAKEQALRLKATERMLKQLIGDMPVALCLVDAHLRIYYRNHRFMEQLGYTEQEVPTLREWALRAYPDPTYRAEVSERWKLAKAQAMDGRIAPGSYRITSRDGTHRVMDVSGLIVRGTLLVTFEDHTEHQAQAELLRKLAYVDGLTGIANRRSLDERLANEWSRCARSRSPMALLMIDIDHFKAYNDRYGHQKGDACLQAVARALTGCMARPHDVVARYGGEEFACLLPECDAAGACVVAERMCGAVYGQAIAHQDSPVAHVVTVSIGVACCIPEVGANPAVLVEQADAHLYGAKKAGRNRVFDEAD